MKAGLWVPDGMEKEIRPGMEVTLELDGGGPVFCGIVERAAAGKEKGLGCVYIEAETGSRLLDLAKRAPFFPEEGAQL